MTTLASQLATRLTKRLASGDCLEGGVWRNERQQVAFAVCLGFVHRSAAQSIQTMMVIIASELLSSCVCAAVEEALCHGWNGGLLPVIDDTDRLTVAYG